jgi:hypothetical protein
MVIGILTTFITKKHFKYGKSLGLLMAISTFLTCRKMITAHE